VARSRGALGAADLVFSGCCSPVPVSLDPEPITMGDKTQTRLAILGVPYLGCILRVRPVARRAAFMALAALLPIGGLRAQAPAPSPQPTAANAPSSAQAQGQPQTPQQAKPSPATPSEPAATAAPAPVAPPPPNWPINDKPVTASVVWDSRGLMIDADNSSLDQILKDVSTDTGAKVEGMGADQRVFGTYGPGPARQVLSDLLDGTGYNVLMFGDQGEGTPREIVLSAPPSGPAPANNNRNLATEEEYEPEPQPEPMPPPEPAPSASEPASPGPPLPRTPQQMQMYQQEMQQRQQQYQQQFQQQYPQQPNENQPPNNQQ
jgi:hypothetical protein